MGVDQGGVQVDDQWVTGGDRITACRGGRAIGPGRKYRVRTDAGDGTHEFVACCQLSTPSALDSISRCIYNCSNNYSICSNPGMTRRGATVAIPRRILIVGGGIAGLTFAAALKHHGATADMVDLAPEWRPVGSGIAIGFNGILALNTIGMGVAVQDRGVPLNKVTIFDSDGSHMNGFGFGAVADVYGTTTIGIHRGALHDALAASLENNPRLGVTVTGLRELPGGIVAEFSDGTSAEYDLVVGADGRASQVRKLIFGEIERRYAGYSAIRVVIPRPTGFEGMSELWGSGRRMGILPIGDDLLYSYSTFPSARGVVRDASESMRLLRELFGSFDGPARYVVESNPDDASIHSGDIEEVILTTWVTRRVALIGDAAHAMCPDLGQGGSMAIEDAITLARTLNNSPEIGGALLEYQIKRSRRVRDIQRKSHQYGWMVHRKTRPALAVRRGIFKRLESDRLARITVASLINPVY
ncbi:FAD-dependent monooxygenase [Nocardia sp. NPDC059091]|uniref:FAD-dependent monooxygenase n=1 Tax=unclassified Nocardia TaxID=2637762 RepID=UPI0036B46156